MWREGATLSDAVPDVADDYNSLPLPFTSVLLGMGTDGHTASLFPGAEGLENAFDLSQPRLCTAITAIQSSITGKEVQRLSLTAKAISAASHVTLMITGHEKRNIFEACMSDDPESPIARIATSLQTPMQVYWAP